MALVSDRRALAVLAGAGFTSADRAARDTTVTVNAGIDDGQGARIDCAYPDTGVLTLAAPVGAMAVPELMLRT